MQWTDEERVGFTDDAAPWMIYAREEKYNVKDQEADESSILNYYRKLFKLRKCDVFQNGSWTLLDTKETLYAYKREYEKKEALILCNFSSELEVFEYAKLHEYLKPALNTEGVEINKSSVIIPPYGACVLITE